jgi:3-hydroxymyristoyl/3-hydroxydecanoyl-(acyl carrier protein) dehydratase
MTMETVSQRTILERFAVNTVNHSVRLAEIQTRLMESRRLDLEWLAGRIFGEITGSNQPLILTQPVLFDSEWLKEFATGDITRCLGNEFSIYAGRKSPRIPNGDLMLISRIKNIDGTHGDFTRSSGITAEYDVSPDGWFLSGRDDGTVPVSILMEIALQPCGVLSAWMHTQLRYPEIDFLFRNLDGALTLIESMNLSGKTITTRAVLDKSSFSGSTIIQHFTYSLSCDGREFLKGQTTFGYFPEQTMAAQTGLDNGQRTSPPGKTAETSSSLTVYPDLANNPKNNLPLNKLRMIDTISVSRDRKTGNPEYILSGRRNNPSDWYYTNHFLGDPVMPGSLGVETIFQAFSAGIMSGTDRKSSINIASGHELTWKYRGQVLPANNQVHVDIQIHAIETTPSGTIYTGSANLWADDLRIYEIQNIALIQLPEEA